MLGIQNPVVRWPIILDKVSKTEKEDGELMKGILAGGIPKGWKEYLMGRNPKGVLEMACRLSAIISKTMAAIWGGRIGGERNDLMDYYHKREHRINLWADSVVKEYYDRQQFSWETIDEITEGTGLEDLSEILDEYYKEPKQAEEEDVGRWTEAVIGERIKRRRLGDDMRMKWDDIPGIHIGPGERGEDNRQHFNPPEIGKGFSKRYISKRGCKHDNRKSCKECARVAQKANEEKQRMKKRKREDYDKREREEKEKRRKKNLGKGGEVTDERMSKRKGNSWRNVQTWGLIVNTKEETNYGNRGTRKCRYNSSFTQDRAPLSLKNNQMRAFRGYTRPNKKYKRPLNNNRSLNKIQERERGEQVPWGHPNRNTSKGTTNDTNYNFDIDSKAKPQTKIGPCPINRTNTDYTPQLNNTHLANNTTQTNTKEGADINRNKASVTTNKDIITHTSTRTNPNNTSDKHKAQYNSTKTYIDGTNIKANTDTNTCTGTNNPNTKMDTHTVTDTYNKTKTSTHTVTNTVTSTKSIIPTHTRTGTSTNTKINTNINMKIHTSPNIITNLNPKSSTKSMSGHTVTTLEITGKDSAHTNTRKTTSTCTHTSNDTKNNTDTRDDIHTYTSTASLADKNTDTNTETYKNANMHRTTSTSTYNTTGRNPNQKANTDSTDTNNYAKTSTSLSTKTNKIITGITNTTTASNINTEINTNTSTHKSASTLNYLHTDNNIINYNHTNVNSTTISNTTTETSPNPSKNAKKSKAIIIDSNIWAKEPTVKGRTLEDNRPKSLRIALTAGGLTKNDTPPRTLIPHRATKRLVEEEMNPPKGI
eukprot:TRINITY_DN3918_c0_g2_i10.p1 TRINITY_DN3918_c0_g2~~TRINITY_DN3918_c0_g2_i10.p1  ORF type:complete len:819 (+),score=141.76 TRINITY_DN3918_c0_g2_i10:247-2703(+)